MLESHLKLWCWFPPRPRIQCWAHGIHTPSHTYFLPWVIWSTTSFTDCVLSSDLLPELQFQSQLCLMNPQVFSTPALPTVFPVSVNCTVPSQLIRLLKTSQQLLISFSLSHQDLFCLESWWQCFQIIPGIRVAATISSQFLSHHHLMWEPSAGLLVVHLPVHELGARNRREHWTKAWEREKNTVKSAPLN